MKKVLLSSTLLLDKSILAFGKENMVATIDQMIFCDDL